MARMTVEERLEEYDRRHRDLAAQIAEIGIVAAGSVTRRLHPLHIGGLPVQRGPAYPSWPLLAVDCKGERQDRDQAID